MANSFYINEILLPANLHYAFSSLEIVNFQWVLTKDGPIPVKSALLSNAADETLGLRELQ